MITQNDIEEFFLKMVEELRKENIPIMNNYHLDFRDYPYQEEIDQAREKELKEEEEDGYYAEEDHIVKD